ncbi:MAG: aldehyde dehydrogenase [Deltaproteobacteria bacterium]|nr:aldehyde dehydrogenase [Deltaproteobacteria bacterium]
MAIDETSGAGSEVRSNTTTPIQRGSAVFSEAPGELASDTRSELDAALEALHGARGTWVQTSAAERLALLEQISNDLFRVAERWVAACAEAKGIDPASSRVGEEWGAFAVVMRLLSCLREAYRDIIAVGRPRIPGPIIARPDGQVVARVFPGNTYDRLFYMGQTGEVWLDPELSLEAFPDAHAAVCRPPEGDGSVSLVLGAGNFSNLGPGDVLHKLFSEHRVVILKCNPVNDYLRPLIEEAFRALVEAGFLRVVSGGAAEGAYLIQHELVDDLHLTGSDKTYEAIVFGVGEEGRKRKAERRPIVTKPFSCELGNLSPVIVVPGPWSARDLAYQGEHLASMITFNAGFNCLSTRVIVQHRGWEHRQALLDVMRRVFRETAPRKAYYPGAEAIHRDFVQAHPEAEQFGDPPTGALPWTLISDVDPAGEDDPCFTREAFCSLMSETALEAPSPADFVDEAVAFVNERVWGTLTATLLVHPASLRDPELRAAVDRAVANLRYGTVGVNLWGIMGFLMKCTWGAFPGHPSHDIQSGQGVVNNSLMLPRVQKSVIRGPFRQLLKPPVFVSHRAMVPLYERFVDFERQPSVFKVPGITWAAMRG